MEQKTLLKNKKNQGNGGETMAKRDDSVKKKVPELRFKGFTDDWEQRRFGSTVTIERGGSPRPISKYITNSEDGLNWIKIGDAPEEGNYITHTAEKILPEGLSKTREVHPGDLILSNSMSFGKPYIMEIDGCIHDGWLLIRNDKNKFELKFLCVLLGTDNMINQYKAMAAGSTVNNLNKQLVGGTTVSFPSSPEQQQIGAFFDHLDTLISLHQRKLDLLKEQKKGFLQKMFPKNGEKVPELRFAGFADDWEQRKFEDLLDSKDGVRRGPFGGALKKEFFVENSEYVVYEQQNAIYDNYHTRYKITKEKFDELSKFKLNPGDFIMSGAGTIGRISRVPDGVKLGVFNQALIRFRINPEITDSEYFIQFVRADFMQKNLTGANPGSAITNLVPMSEVKKWEIKVPHLEEQEKIGSFFAQLDNTISLHQRKLDLLKEQKKGFLQKMFV